MYVRLFIVTFLISSVSISAAADPPEIHSKHWLHGYPLGTPTTNDLIIRDIYALSSNDERKFADWVAYRLTPREVTGTLDLERKWRADPWLADDETLEPSGPDDYGGAHDAHDYDRGHFAPLASFKGSLSASQTNYLSNISPQKADLNQGPWKDLENAVRTRVKTGATVWVTTGPLYEDAMSELPNADEEHVVPSGYWKIVATEAQGELRVAAFIMGQDADRHSDPADFLTSVDEIEERSGLGFFWELPEAEQTSLEAGVDATWLIQ